MNFLDILNEAAYEARPTYRGTPIFKSMDERLNNGILDSLDYIMVLMFISVIYGIPDEVAKEAKPLTVKDIYDFVQANKTKEPSTMEDVVRSLK